MLPSQTLKGRIAKRAELKDRIIKEKHQLRAVKPALEPSALCHQHSAQTTAEKDALPEGGIRELAVEMNSFETQTSEILLDDVATIQALHGF